MHRRKVNKPVFSGLAGIADSLSGRVKSMKFGKPITHVYNPLEYAFEPYRQFVERFGSSLREVVLLGMNPGPWEMAQTGVPFGEVNLVRDWLGVFAAGRARVALEGLDVTVGRILHPSPANAPANRDWATQAANQLAAYGIRIGRR